MRPGSRRRVRGSGVRDARKTRGAGDSRTGTDAVNRRGITAPVIRHASVGSRHRNARIVVAPVAIRIVAIKWRPVPIRTRRIRVKIRRIRIRPDTERPGARRHVWNIIPRPDGTPERHKRDTHHDSRTEPGITEIRKKDFGRHVLNRRDINRVRVVNNHIRDGRLRPVRIRGCHRLRWRKHRLRNRIRLNGR